VLNPQEILKYDPQSSVRGMLNGRVPGLFGSNDIRGVGNPLYVINGVPREGVDISLQEIEQVTILKDLSTMMLYGSHANNGVVLITTRRGSPLKKEVNFTAKSGINIPISYPKYLKAGDYMELYNEALKNDGLEERYSDDIISATRSGTDNILYPDVNYYNSTYLKDWSNSYNIIGEITGGNEIGQFYLNVGWDRSTGILALGEGDDEKTDRFNLRSNIDYRVNDDIDLNFDGAVIFNFSRGPRYTSDNFWQLSSTYKPNIYNPLIPAELITDENMLSGAKLVDKKYVLGGTSEYLTNIFGELTRNGTRRTNDKLIELNTGLDFDLSGLTEGLSARAYISFDMYSMFSEGLMNSYSVYRPNFSADTIASFTKLGQDVKMHERTISDVTFFRRYGAYGMFDYKKIFGDHRINANALVFLNRYDQEDVLQPMKSLHYGLRVNHMFKNKYITELTGVYTGSGKLYHTDRVFAFSPGVGLGWIVSEESFLNENTIINYLKLNANWAINNTDENIINYRQVLDYYVRSGSVSYYHGQYSNPGVNIFPGNKKLEMEKTMNMNLGVEARLLDYRLGIEGSYFYNKNYDLIEQRLNTLPNYFGSIPYENFGSYQHKGVETGLTYDMSMGDVKLKLGTNLTYSVSKVLLRDELIYVDKYRRTVGQPTEAIFGYVALGLFEDQSEIDNHAVQSFGIVQPGDIKYEDLNKDGTIDENDQKMIGRSKPVVQYDFHLQLTYKGLDLFALGTGQNGQDSYFNNSYYWVYGDRKYSETVLNRWTPETASTANYPRLSSSSNSNNFRNSTFWLHERNWFTLHTIQMTYTLPARDIVGLDNVSFFLRGNNLFTISDIREKMELNVGSAPQTRAYILGMKLMF